MLVFVYSPYHLNLSFPHLVVIPTTLETPKNFLAFSTQIFRLFWIPPKNPHLNQATQKNTCQIFLPKQIPGIENLKPQKILWSSLSLEIQCIPLPPLDGNGMQRNAWVHTTMDGHSLIVLHVIQAQSSTLWYHHINKTFFPPPATPCFYSAGYNINRYNNWNLHLNNALHALLMVLLGNLHEEFVRNIKCFTFGDHFFLYSIVIFFYKRRNYTLVIIRA